MNHKEVINTLNEVQNMSNNVLILYNAQPALVFIFS